MRALGRSAGVLQPKLLTKDEARRMAVNFAKRANVRLTPLIPEVSLQYTI
jgi:hypothetical protein